MVEELLAGRRGDGGERWRSELQASCSGSPSSVLGKGSRVANASYEGTDVKRTLKYEWNDELAGDTCLIA